MPNAPHRLRHGMSPPAGLNNARRAMPRPEDVAHHAGPGADGVSPFDHLLVVEEVGALDPMRLELTQVGYAADVLAERDVRERLLRRALTSGQKLLEKRSGASPNAALLGEVEHGPQELLGLRRERHFSGAHSHVRAERVEVRPQPPADQVGVGVAVAGQVLDRKVALGPLILRGEEQTMDDELDHPTARALFAKHIRREERVAFEGEEGVLVGVAAEE